jgi:hypothetical protein
VKNTLAAVSLAGLLGASGFVAWSVFSRPDASALTAEQARSFDFKDGPLPSTIVRVTPPVEDLHDAVAAPVSPRPIALDIMARAGAPAAAVKPRLPAFATPRLEAAVRRHPFFAGLLRAPARFLMSGTALKSPRALRAFLADKPAVEAYMSSTLMRLVLNSPSAAKSVLGSPVLVRAFLASPAMSDPAAVRELLGSRMLVKMLDCPGVQQALADPAVIRGMVADPGTLQWLAENPSALQAIAGAAPALARSLGAASGR